MAKRFGGGLGNRSGLHSYADTVLREKFEKSGPRFEKKLATLKGKVTVFDFRNIDRDRGRWLEVNEIKL